MDSGYLVAGDINSLNLLVFHVVGGGGGGSPSGSVHDYVMIARSHLELIFILRL